MAAVAVNGLARTSSTTRDYLAISKTSRALTMHSTALLAVHGTSLAMDGAALAMDSLSMQRCVARPVRGAHNLAEVEVVIMRNFTPAFASFKLPCDRVEALARCFGEQVRIFQAAVAEPAR